MGKPYLPNPIIQRQYKGLIVASIQGKPHGNPINGAGGKPGFNLILPTPADKPTELLPSPSLSKELRPQVPPQNNSGTGPRNRAGKSRLIMYMSPPAKRAKRLTPKVIWGGSPGCTE